MIISISGKKLAGKDTAASFLKGFKRYAFADYLKKGCSEAFMLPLTMFHDQKLKEEPFKTPIVLDYQILNVLCDVFKIDPTEEYYQVGFGVALTSPRHMLQFIGTDLVRKTIKDSFWVDATIDHLKGESCDVYLSDARFFNERQMLKSLGAKLVLVKRILDNTDTHVSENDLGNESEYDYVIENYGTKIQLQEKIEKLIKDLR